MGEGKERRGREEDQFQDELYSFRKLGERDSSDSREAGTIVEFIIAVGVELKSENLRGEVSEVSRRGPHDLEVPRSPS